MSTNLYQEAIVEARQLREMAEQNAKNKIIEAVTPQIRRLIEQQLVGDDEEELDLIIGDESFEEEELLAPPVEDTETIDLGALAAQTIEEFPGDEEELDIETSSEPSSKVSITVQGDLNMELEGEEEEEEEMLLSQEGMAHLENFLQEYNRNNSVNYKIKILKRRVKTLKEALKSVDLRKISNIHRQVATAYYTNLLREAYKLADSVILINESTDKRLVRQILVILKEIKDMSRRRDAAVFRRLFEELADEGLDETWGLSEQDDEVAVEDVEVEEEVAEDEVAITADQVRDAVAAMVDELGVDSEEVVLPAEDAGGEEGVEVEVDEEELSLESYLYETDDEEEEEEETVEEVYEIDETSIRRELRRLRRLREQEEGRAAAADPALAHGGEDEGDVFVDVDEETLLNALADELGDPGVPTPTVESRRRRNMHRRSRTSRARQPARVNESGRLRNKVNRTVRANAQLKRQLQEMNLFNAKLLFANKLMQNRSLSNKQQHVIVEALDKAKTIREAKLLYKGLSSSLNRKSGRTLSEGRTRLLASSSRSTRSASPSSNGSADRWAVLAGINTSGK